MAIRTKEAVKKNMQAIRSKNTKIELIVARALWAKGYRYRRNNRKVFGSPDFTFAKYKVAVFCDSVFWHGKNWDLLKQRIKTNRDFWWKKIESNIARDRKVNAFLRQQGWEVLRFWEDDIEKNLLSVISQIEVTVLLQQHCSSQIKNARLQGRTVYKSTLLNNYPRFLCDKEQILLTPHLYE